MNNDDFESLQRGLEQARAFQDGAREGYTIHEPADVKARPARSKRRTAKAG